MMEERSKLPPGREPLRSDWFAEQLGRSQQKVMGLTVKCRRLEIAEQKARERGEILEELVMDLVADMREGRAPSEMLARVRKVVGELDGDD